MIHLEIIFIYLILCLGASSYFILCLKQVVSTPFSCLLDQNSFDWLLVINKKIRTAGGAYVPDATILGICAVNDIISIQ